MTTWMGRRFGQFEPLWPAERRLVDEMGTGMEVRISHELPPVDAPKDRRIRASFLRYLALGGCDACRPPEKGVRVRGAFIEGNGPAGAETRGLDLEGCTVAGDLGLVRCRFPELVLLRAARIATLSLGESALACGLRGDRLVATGGVSGTRRTGAGAARLRTSFVPVVSMGQTAEFRPDMTERWGLGLQAFLWLHAFFGWLIGGIAAAGVLGLFQRR